MWEAFFDYSRVLCPSKVAWISLEEATDDQLLNLYLDGFICLISDRNFFRSCCGKPRSSTPESFVPLNLDWISGKVQKVWRISWEWYLRLRKFPMLQIKTRMDFSTCKSTNDGTSLFIDRDIFIKTTEIAYVTLSRFIYSFNWIRYWREHSKCINNLSLSGTYKSTCQAVVMVLVNDRFIRLPS